jgi:TatD DNase family protein
MFIDTHCHLTFEEYKDDRPMVIGNAKKAGVKKMICVGVDGLSSRLSTELSRNNTGTIFASIGFHPYEASHNPDLSILDSLLSTSRQQIIAIGECGLDYHMFKGEMATGKKQEQRILFEQHLRLAAAHNLPVIMHVRDAYEDFFNVLDAQPALPRGVIHCFSGGLQEIREAQKRELFVGIDGNISYSKQLRVILPHIPLGIMLLETDAPYLTPVPHRGTRNEPKYIPLVAACVSELLSIPVNDVASKTTQNALSLFGMV